MARTRHWKELLRYTQEKVPGATLRRAYAEYRNEQGLPNRCDNPNCTLHTPPLVWNGQPLVPHLDHVNGVNSDNRPENLRYLCPNCHAQQPTTGGGNKGKVEKSSGGFAVRDEQGRKHYRMPAEGVRPSPPKE